MEKWGVRKMRTRAALTLVTCLALAAEVAIPAGDVAVAATKSQRCEAYAHNMARSAPTRGDPVRGAIVGGAIGSFGAAAGAGAAVGAGVGLTRRAVQRSRAFNHYYHRCMAR
jgi:hypothetical protein